MKKIDLHMHVSAETICKNGKVFISDPESMLGHMDELEIEKAVLMSAGESTGISYPGKPARRFSEPTPGDCADFKFRWELFFS